jgi:hypothetical protein
MQINPRSETLVPYPAELPAAGSSSPEASTGGHGADFGRLLTGLGRELDRGERLAERAAHGGGGMSPDALIALQAGIYRYAEAVDLVSKLVDRGTQAIKTTLQNQ